MRYNSNMTRIALLAALAATSLLAQDWARARVDKSPRHREWVTVKHDGRAVETFVAYPESKDKTPVVLIIHEIFGMTDWVEDVADQFAAAGYIAVAPDLLSGMGPNGGRTKDFKPGDAMPAVSHLDPAQVTADLNAVADYALQLPAAAHQLFAAGFCWGGGQTFRFATNRPDLAAALVFYGPPPDKDAMSRIKAPVYGFYAGNDARIDATIPAAKEDMQHVGKFYEPLIYEGAGHGFMRAGEDPAATEANAKARTDAWVRVKHILAEPAPRKAFAYPYSQDDFPNGLRLVTIPTGYPNIVALYIVVATGSRNEVESGHTGFAHLFEHLMFRGTDKFPPEKYQAVLQHAGAASNASTSDDFTVYHTIFSKDDLDAILAMEADRFQNLHVAEPQFKTEALAVLGEYNKNSANPTNKLDEVMHDAAFDRHTYKHTTMGFIKDIQDMPNQYEYSLKFFDRYYRPEYTTIIVAGDVQQPAVHAMVDKYWSKWVRGSYHADIPTEPSQQAPRTDHVDWPSPTLPWVAIAYHSPAYTDTGKAAAALDALGFLGFSENSDLYQKLVIQEQKVDTLYNESPDRVDPGLFAIAARVKNPADLDYVRDQILDTVSAFAAKPVPADRLEAVKKHLRYSFILRLNNSESIAGTTARFVALRRTPETINRLYEMYAQLTPEDIQHAARDYLTDNNRTTVTLTGAAVAKGGAQ